MTDNAADMAEGLTPAQRDTIRAMVFGFDSIDVTGPDVLRPPSGRTAGGLE